MAMAVMKVTYIYDSQGNRVSRTVGANVTRYQVDSNRALPEVLTEYIAATKFIASYTYGNKLISQRLGTQTAYYHAEASVAHSCVTDATGQVLISYTYDPSDRLQVKLAALPTNSFLLANVAIQLLDKITCELGTTIPLRAALPAKPLNGSQNNPITLHKLCLC